MNRRIVFAFALLTLVALVGVPEASAQDKYLTNLTAVHGSGSCGTCHINASGGGVLTSYGSKFAAYPGYTTDPSGALRAIGPPPSTTVTGTPTATMTGTPMGTPTATMTGTPMGTPTATMTGTPMGTPTVTPAATPVRTPTPAITTVMPTATPTPEAPGFGFVVALAGLMICAFLARRYNK